MFTGCVWVHSVYSPLEWKDREKCLLITVRVYGEALELLSPNHKSDSREGKENDEKHLITQNSVMVSLTVTKPARKKEKPTYWL